MNIMGKIKLLISIISILTLIVIWLMHKLKILRCTEKTEGEIVEKGLEKSDFGSWYVHKEDLYMIVQYVIENKIYQKKIQTGTTWDTLDGRPKGTLITGISLDVYYNPKNFNDCYIKGKDYEYRQTVLYSSISVAIINCILYMDVIIMFVGNIISKIFWG